MRANEIAERLTRSFREDFGCLVITVSAETWLELPLEPRFRYGYMPPIPITNTGTTFLVLISPSLVDSVTAWLEEDLLDTYLTAIEAFVGAHLMEPAESTDDTMKRVEDELYEQAPDVLSFVTNVEARAIDDGVVPTLP